LIEQPWGVTAFGRGTSRSEPDRAVVRFVVNRVSDSPKTSLEEAKTAVTAVRSALRALGIGDDNLTSSRTRIHSEWSGFGVDRRFAGHRCRVEFSVSVTALDVVEQAVIDVVDAGADEILGVVYESSRADELRADARERAVAAAHAKARLYAEAANIRLGPVVHIEDLDADRPGGDLPRSAPMGGGTGRSDDLAPGQVTVSAAVVLGFSIAR
jgi:uncharacterized protein